MARKHKGIGGDDTEWRHRGARTKWGLEFLTQEV
jgi:hypothetical protein